MSSLLCGLTLLVAAYLADLMADHWGFRGQTSMPARQASTRRRISSRPNGQPTSRSPARRTGMRSA